MNKNISVIIMGLLWGTFLYADLETGPNNLPNDPLFNQQWGLYNPDNNFDVGVLNAWKKNKGSKDIAIVVIGTGIDYNHPDLKNNMWVNPNEIPGNGIDDDNNGYIDDIHGVNVIEGSGDPMDDHGHGTHIAGVIGAEGNNGIGISGVMQKVSLIACKFLSASGGGTTEDAIKCLEYVADLAQRDDIGVKIVATNNAWGGGPTNEALKNMIKIHNDLGILFVTGSGSSAINLDNNDTIKEMYQEKNVIIVAKMNPQGKLTSFSNFGPNTIHLAAPGLDILSTTLNESYEKMSGSAATSFVTGTIGLLASHMPSLTMSQLKFQLLANTRALNGPDEQAKIISGGHCYAELK